MAPTFLAILIFALAVYYLFWGGRRLKDHERKRAQRLIEEAATFRYQVANKKRGFLLDDSVIIYRSEEGDERQIALSNIALIAEYVSDDVLWTTQYHTIVVIDRSGHEMSWNADHIAPETIDQITAALGTQRTEPIGWRIKMTSRVMYPRELWGQDLYDEMLSVGEKNWVHTKEVKDYLSRLLAGE